MTIGERVAKILIDEKVVDEEKYELYAYSVQVLIENLLHIASIVCIGGLLGKWEMMMVYLLVMVPLRSMIGGCHLSNAYICFITSTILVVICFVAPQYMEGIPSGVYIVVSICMLVVIEAIAPVDCIEKPMEACEKKKIHKRIRAYVILFLAFFFLQIRMENKQILAEIAIILSSCVVTLFIEIIKKQRRGSNGKSLEENSNVVPL